MLRGPPRSTLTSRPFPYTTLFRPLGRLLGGRRVFGYRFDDRRLGGGFRLGIVRRRGFRLGIGLLPASAAAALGLRFRVFGFRIGGHRLEFGYRGHYYRGIRRTARHRPHMIQARRESKHTVPADAPPSRL